jgi:uncharacterized protein YjaZ
MRDELKKYRVAVQCFCGEKIIVESDSLAHLLSNIQLNMLGHIKSRHPEEMDKFKQHLRENMMEMLNKMFDEMGDFFKGEDWKWKQE